MKTLKAATFKHQCALFVVFFILPLILFVGCNNKPPAKSAEMIEVDNSLNNDEKLWLNLCLKTYRMSKCYRDLTAMRITRKVIPND